jgi:hypothetical protein
MMSVSLSSSTLSRCFFKSALNSEKFATFIKSDLK